MSINPSEILRVLIKVSRRAILWGPEAILLQKFMTEAWNEAGGAEHLQTIATLLDPEGLEPDREAIFDLLEDVLPEVAKEAAEASYHKINAMMVQLTVKARTHFQKQKVEATKFNQNDWDAYIAAANADQLAVFQASFPDRILHPEVNRMVELAQDKTNLRTIDRANLQDRMRRITDMPSRYFENVSDVQAGRTWTQTGIAMAHAEGITEYQVISEGDRNVCPVCARLDGKVFEVPGAMARLEAILELQDPAAITAAAPFPRLADVDNKGLEEVKAGNWFPPFHGRCRCEVVFGWATASRSIQLPPEPPAIPPPIVQAGRTPAGPVSTKPPAWKPTMTRAEAEAWASDSVLKDIDFHHGTMSSKVADQIRKQGFSSSKLGSANHNGGYLGSGHYFTDDVTYASQYTRGKGTALVTKIKVNNPLNAYSDEAMEIFGRTDLYHKAIDEGISSFDDLVAYARSFGGAELESDVCGFAYAVDENILVGLDPDDFKAAKKLSNELFGYEKTITHIAKADGYDAIYAGLGESNSEIVVFGKTKIVVIEG